MTMGRSTPKHGRHLARYREITMVLVNHRLGELIKLLDLTRFLPFHWVPPGNPLHRETSTTSERTRMAIEELGTTFIKVGQILSTRTDILPSEYTEELSKLQNSLPPLPFSTIEEVILQEFGKPVNEVFKSFEKTPIGVASIGQAHIATLTDGTDVVIKVQKPGVQAQVEEDLEILHHIAENAAERSENTGQYDFPRIIDEISEALKAEMDYIREGHIAEHFAIFFKDDPNIHIPKIYWQYTTPRVITLERIKGIGILNLQNLAENGVDRQQLAKRVASIWIRMIFEDMIFHADPHPGNVLLEPDGRIGLVDFGMNGVLDDEMRDHLAMAIKAILGRDADMLADSLLDLGVVSDKISRSNLRADLKHLMGHYPLDMPELRLTSNVGELFTVIQRNRIILPANTFLLLKTLAMAQSLGRGLDTNYNFFESLQVYVNKLFKERYSLSAVLNRLPGAALDMVLLGIDFPKQLLRIVRSIERGNLNVKTDVSGLEVHLEHLERLVNRMVLGLLVSALILAAALIFLAFHRGL